MFDSITPYGKVGSTFSCFETMMNFIENAREGLANLYYAKLRSVLAFLGVLVGTASVVAMVLGGELATYEALKQFKSLGTDLLAISINNATEENETGAGGGKEENLTLNQALSLAKADHNILKIAPYTQLFNPMYYNGNLINGLVLGVTDSFADVVHVTLAKGRFISIADGYQFYCVVGRTIYESIKKYTHKEPIGEQLQIGKNIFVIVGIAESWPENNFVYANIDNSVLVPLMASTVLSKYANISNIIMRLKPNTDLMQLQNNLNDAVTQKVSGKMLNFRSAKELIARMKKQSDILTVFLGMIGGVSLLVGGIGVMNIMLVSVMERRREIGIRLAVGARRFDIGALFLIEAIMLSLVGGFAGVLIGVLIAYVIAMLWHWEFTLFIWPPLVGFSVSVAVGIFFGFYPAYKASCLSPIDALKTE